LIFQVKDLGFLRFVRDPVQLDQKKAYLLGLFMLGTQGSFPLRVTFQEY